MKYILKDNIAKEIRATYKNIYFMKKVGISRSYTSLILNRRRSCPKVVAYTITKAINPEAEINDYFEVA